MAPCAVGPVRCRSREGLPNLQTETNSVRIGSSGFGPNRIKSNCTSDASEHGPYESTHARNHASATLQQNTHHNHSHRNRHRITSNRIYLHRIESNSNTSDYAHPDSRPLQNNEIDCGLGSLCHQGAICKGRTSRVLAIACFRPPQFSTNTMMRSAFFNNSRSPIASPSSSNSDEATHRPHHLHKSSVVELHNRQSFLTSTTDTYSERQVRH